MAQGALCPRPRPPIRHRWNAKLALARMHAARRWAAGPVPAVLRILANSALNVARKGPPPPPAGPAPAARRIPENSALSVALPAPPLTGSAPTAVQKTPLPLSSAPSVDRRSKNAARAHLSYIFGKGNRPLFPFLRLDEGVAEALDAPFSIVSEERNTTYHDQSDCCVSVPVLWRGTCV